MKFKKVIAALSAVTMLGSLAVAVPASAEESSAEKVDYSSAVHFRANGDSNTTFSTYDYVTKDSETTLTGKEFQGYNQFGIILGFDLSTLANKLNLIDSVNLVVYKSAGSGDIGVWNFNDTAWRTNATTISSNKTGDDAKALINSIKSNITNFGTNTTTSGDASGAKAADAYASVSGSTWSVNISDIVKSSSDLANVDMFINPRYYDTPNNAATSNGNERTQFRTDLTGTNKPYVTYTLKEAVAKIGDVEYATLYEAVNAAATGDTIELLKNVTIQGTSDRVIIDKNAKKAITINGNGHTVTNSATGALFEVNDGSTVTLNNITVTKLDFKGSAVINATGLTVETLQLGGTYSNSKGTIKDSTITTLDDYGKITLENTDVTNLNCKKITNTTDQPVIIADAESTITNVKVEEIADTAVLPYTLFDGALIPAKVTLPDGYSYANGVIKAAHSEAFTFTKTLSEIADAAQVKVVFQNDSTNTTKDYSEPLYTTFTDNGTAQLAVVIKNIADGYSVKSVTIE